MQTARENQQSPAARRQPDAAPRDLSYSVFLLCYLGLWAAFLGILNRLGYTWPAAVSGIDVLLLCLATFRLTEVITEEKVARCLRAPFCDRVAVTGPEGTERHEEVPAGGGLRRVVGKFLLCPWCTGVWVATLLVFFWAVAPGMARLVLIAFAASAGGMIFQVLTKLMDRTRNCLPPGEGG